MSDIWVYRITSALKRRRDGLSIAAVFVALVVVHLVLSRDMATPGVVSDEFGYFANARYIAGLDAVPVQPHSPFYSVGWSTLLAVPYMLGMDAEGVYRTALVMNAVIGAGLLLVLMPIARQVFGLGHWVALGSATVVACYPALLLTGSLTWPETLLFFLAALWALIGLRTIQRGGFIAAMSFAIVTGALFFVHARTVPIVVVSLVFLAYMGVRRRLSVGVAAGAITTIVGSIAGVRLLEARVRDAIYVGSVDPYGEGGPAETILNALTTPSSWSDVLFRGAGQLWYLGVASVGLIVIGVVALVRDTRQKNVQRPDARLARGLILAGFLSAFALGIVFLGAAVESGMRIDKFFYGRYVEYAALVPMLAGVAALGRAGGTAHRVLLGAVGAGVTVAAGALMYFGIGPSAFRDDHMHFATILGVLAPGGVLELPVQRSFDVLLATFVAVACIAVFCALLSISRHAAFVVLIAAAVGSAVLVQERLLTPIGQGIRGSTLLSESAAFENVDDVAYDMASYHLFGLYAYQFWQPTLQFRLFDSSKGDAPPSSTVVAAPDWDKAGELDARGIAVEALQAQAIWALPSQDLNRLIDRGAVLTQPLHARLPPSAMRSRITPSTSRLTVAAGGTLHVPLRVTNTGRGTAWRQASFAKGGDAPGYVFVDYAWSDAEGRAVTGTRFAGHLDRTTAPGQESRSVAVVTATDDSGEPLARGEYVVRLGMVQHEQAAFRDVTGDPLPEITVRVT